MCLHISHTCVYTYKEGNLTTALRSWELNTRLGLEEGFKTNSSFKQSLESSRGKGERGGKKNPTKTHTNKKRKKKHTVLLPDNRFLCIKLIISADGASFKLHSYGERWNIPNISFVTSPKHLLQHLLAYVYRCHKQKQFGPHWSCCHLGIC